MALTLTGASWIASGPAPGAVGAPSLSPVLTADPSLSPVLTPGPTPVKPPCTSGTINGWQDDVNGTCVPAN